MNGTARVTELEDAPDWVLARDIPACSWLSIQHHRLADGEQSTHSIGALTSNYWALTKASVLVANRTDNGPVEDGGVWQTPFLARWLNTVSIVGRSAAAKEEQ